MKRKPLVEVAHHVNVRKARPTMHKSACRLGMGVSPAMSLLMIIVVSIFSHTSTESVSSYEWESWNHYEILDLATQVSSSKRQKQKHKHISLQDIRKAYRRQAQLHHPDKVKTRNCTKEESNSRFARIAEAYDVLSNEDSRREYDFGFEFENDYKVDANKIFEEFFGGMGSAGRDLFDDILGGFSSGGERKFESAPKVSERSEVWYDEYGQEILRVLRREQFTKEKYFRILAQDFIVEKSHFGPDQYIPMSRMYLLE